MPPNHFNLWRIFHASNGLVLAVLLAPRIAAAAEGEPIRVEARASGGAHHVGQGLEIVLASTGADRRPEIESPTIEGADAWVSRNNELRPISATGIGGISGGSNVFVGRIRVVPRRAGTLVIPSIRVHAGDSAGRSRPIRVEVRAVPSEGRPPEYLGGVGRFMLRAGADARSARVGEEVTYRIAVDGPAAWGMAARPDLKRLERPELGLRVAEGPVELVREPPSRTFAYALRPTRAGELVLPPVAVAAYDPASGHYLTRVTPAVSIRVVDVPAFDPSTIPDLGPSAAADRRLRVRDAALAAGAALLLASAVGISWVRRRARRAGRLGGLAEARRLAARLARGLVGPNPPDGPALAAEVVDGLIDFLKLADGRPPGAITPDEAREGVARARGSEALGAEAARIVARCDDLLYRDSPGPVEDPGRLREEARALFARLGSRWSGPRA